MHATRAILVGLLLPFAGMHPGRADELDPSVIRAVDHLAARHDADRNGRIEEAERARLAEVVSRRHGERGIAVLGELWTRADTDGDGVLTIAEWQPIAVRAGVRTSWIVPATHRVRMADGTHLATDVWRRPGAGPGPVLLLRTPYGRRQNAPPLLEEDWVVVVQDMRGRFDSEGDNLPFVGCGWGEHQDGVETVAWIRAQPFCDGRVATYGGSALGITQYLLAGAAPEGVVCQYVTVAAASLYHHAAYVGGALRKSQVEQWLEGNGFADEALRLYRAHPTYDAFWHDFDATRRFGQTTLPAVHLGGFFDTFAQGTVDAFVGRQVHGGAGARDTQFLVLGPWAHGGFRGRNGVGEVGALRFPDAQVPEAWTAHAFFRRHLEGEGEPPPHAVAYYVMGDAEARGAPGNVWRYADAWPPPHEEVSFHLHADGRLARDAVGTEADGAVSWTFDPADPCPTQGGANLVLPAGPLDQRPVEGRPDVLVFTTEALEAPLEIAGSVRAVLFVSSDAVDTDLSVRISDVYPDGRSLLMAEGMLRLRYRGGFERPRPLEPGAVARVEIPCGPTSVAFAPGHRIRVAITSSNFPRFDVNPGTGRPGSPDGRRVIQRNRLHCSPTRPSHLRLPVTILRASR
jgi:predicted acyl esterase